MKDSAIDNPGRFPKLTDVNTKVALVFGESTCTYAELDRRISQFASGLLGDAADLQEQRIAFMVRPAWTM